MSDAPILLIDDNAAHRALVKRAIRKAGVDVPIVEMSSLAEARSRLLGGEALCRPRLGIIDLNLGDGRSTSLIQELRTSAELSQLPILVLSTSPLESDMRESYACGANCYLTKADDVAVFTKEIESGIRFLLGLD